MTTNTVSPDGAPCLDDMREDIHELFHVLTAAYAVISEVSPRRSRQGN